MEVPVGVSARHVHVSEADLRTLFGSQSHLTRRNELRQLGQFASEERVNLIGPKGRIDGVRILGPVRSRTQVEISLTDSYKLGVTPPIRNSGDTSGSPGLTIEGPAGSVVIPEGVIVAQRHIHVNPDQAQQLGVSDGQMVRVAASGIRGLVFENVVCRIRADFMQEMHIDTDEANAAALKSGDKVTLVK